MAYYQHNRIPSIPGTYYEPLQGTSAPPAPMHSNSAVVSAGQHTFEDPFAVGMPLSMAPPQAGMNTAAMVGSSQMPPTASPLPRQHPRTSSGAWSPQDDDTLIRLRARGDNWGQIHDQFPSKTANACRKRHERLMERRHADDFDTRKMEQMAREYMNMRREIWQPLATRLGEKWNVVEQKCMTTGQKNLQSLSRQASRRDRLELNYASGNYEVESGSSGGALTPPSDDIEGASISPHDSIHGERGRSVSGSSHSSGHRYSNSMGHISSPPQRHYPLPSQHHQPMQHMHGPSSSQTANGPGAHDANAPGSYQDYYATPVGFSHSLRSLGSQQQHMSSASPYMSQHSMQSSSRMPTADMGIHSIIDRNSSQAPLQ